MQPCMLRLTGLGGRNRFRPFHRSFYPVIMFRTKGSSTTRLGRTTRWPQTDVGKSHILIPLAGRANSASSRWNRTRWGGGLLQWSSPSHWKYWTSTAFQRWAYLDKSASFAFHVSYLQANVPTREAIVMAFKVNFMASHAIAPCFYDSSGSCRIYDFVYDYIYSFFHCFGISLQYYKAVSSQITTLKRGKMELVVALRKSVRYLWTCSNSVIAIFLPQVSRKWCAKGDGTYGGLGYHGRGNLSTLECWLGDEF